jgi:hypothetical protein
LIILAIDPGSSESGYCFLSGESDTVLFHGKVLNEKILHIIDKNINKCYIVIEKMGSGRIISKYHIDTAIWTGRFVERCNNQCTLIKRDDVLKYFNIRKKGQPFSNIKTSDAKVTFMMRSRYGQNYPVKKDAIQAHALALYAYLEIFGKKNDPNK